MDSLETNAFLESLTNPSESDVVGEIYMVVTHLSSLISHARKHNIEVTLDVQYDRILDGYRPHEVILGLKIAKLLNDRGLVR